MRSFFRKQQKDSTPNKTLLSSQYSLDTWHLSSELNSQVAEWFSQKITTFEVDGSRSVLLPGLAQGASGIKIKGAGYNGGEVRLGVAHRTGPRAPVFDFEGRMMEDVAAGHDNAPSGGASFQQAVTEYQVSARLTELGYPCVPCLGFGRIRQGETISWFSVFRWESVWTADLSFPDISVGRWAGLNMDMGALLVELACLHDLIGYAWYVGLPGDEVLIKDLHPFRQADSINMSQLSWVMQVYFGLHIRTNLLKSSGLKHAHLGLPRGLHLSPVRTFCPEATPEDHDAVRLEVVAPYMISPPGDFSPQQLLKALKGNAITRSLLTLCPEKFTRF